MPPYLKCYVDDNFWLAVYVDADIYQKFSGIHWRIDKDGYAFYKEKLPNRRGVLKAYKVYLHKILMPGSMGKSVHHTIGKLDCRRQNLRVYDTWQQHYEQEHKHRKLTKRERKLCAADLHPWCG